ncbi:ABC transporter permease [Terrimonas sp. NA20]|uniref:ABC transporter permease n=1 Tax=Terrimonas ginsenosidimutans TaxID=2908004 RepID=A0ABS9KT80_9BACT|nr:ABC transporter permease [Terrimonas ginsenosidimutans]MCG2615529.1 ABC transporter permease [Terrimonas ginsenosidimutans]
MDNQDRIWQLYARKMAREASEAELQELHDLVANDPSMDMQLQLMTEFWNNSSPVRELKNDDAFNRILEQATEEQNEIASAKAPARPSVPVHPHKHPAPGFNKSIIRNYAVVAWRNLVRSKSFSAINIAGLALGMVSAVVILLWSFKELSFDQFHSKKERVYHIMNRAKFEENVVVWGATPKPLAAVLEQNYPQVETAVRLNWVALFVLHAGSQQYQEPGYLTDPGFFNVFDFPFLKGDPKTALQSEYSIVLTETMAKKLFGNTNVLGHTVRIDSTDFFTVTGVMKDPPINSSLDFNYVIPWSYMKRVGWDDNNWKNNNVRTVVLMKPGIDEATANKLFANVVKKQVSDSENELFVHPLTKWHLRSGFHNGINDGGEIILVRMFCIIAGFILLIACINYVNMSTARSQKRAREVGIRKVVGAGRGSLITQFLGESVLVSFFAGAIALILLYPALLAFNYLIDDRLSVPFGNYQFWIAAILFMIVTGILAGIYPAFYLSSYQPVKVLKGHFKRIRVFVTPRKMLVTLQFTFAIVMIICTIVIYRQIKHTQERDRGYRGNNLAYMYMKGRMKQNYPAIREELLASNAITDITRSNCPITDVWSNGDDYDWDGNPPGERHVVMRFTADRNYVSAMGLQLLQGRDLDTEKHPADTSSVLINQAAAKMMGISANAVGKKIRQGKKELEVVGVVQNFIPDMPYQAFMPAVIHGDTDNFGAISFRLNEERGTDENLASIAGIFRKYNPDYPFEHFFADEAYEAKFATEKVIGTLAAFFAGLTVFISCLGLFALAACLAESRIKEIGVRKVLGASVTRITALLSKDFFQPIVLAILIASPLAWWGMDHWLSNYAYRTSINWWVIATAALLVILIAIATVSYQTVKAAIANPVRSLKTE